MSYVKEKGLQHTDLNKEVVKALYETFANKLLAYTLKNYRISEDDAWTLVYKTIYKMAEVNDRYTFSDKHKQNSFVFKTHINYLRNYFRDNKSFEGKNREVELKDEYAKADEGTSAPESIELKVLQIELDKLEEWQRILLLMRGQDMPYSEIAAFVKKPEKQLKVYYARLKEQLLKNVNEKLNALKQKSDEK